MMSYVMFDTSSFLSDRIEELYLIGWKGNENIFNTRILKNLRSLQKVIIVNPKQDEVINNIQYFVKLNDNDIECINYNSFEEFLMQHKFIE
ncbi:MAG: hypothetical protein N2449_10475 [Bacteroidales bacterium]|nr:hypothetical protein [Bacteroidales bacterium]